MWRMKGCTRCGGDLFIDRDMDGWYEQCLQCSRRSGLPSLAEINKLPSMELRRAVGSGGRMDDVSVQADSAKGYEG